MVERPIRVLLIEDNPFDVRIIQDILSQAEGTPFEITAAARLSEGLNHLNTGGFDVLLLDLNLPDQKGLSSLGKILSIDKKLPIIIISGIGDEKTALDALKKGAQDYFVKGNLDGRVVTRSIRYAIERNRIEEELKRAREELELRVKERTAQLVRLNEELKKENIDRTRAEDVMRESEEKWRNLFENSIEAVFTMNLKGRIASANDAALALTEYSREELIGKSSLVFIRHDVRRFLREAMVHLYRTDQPIVNLAYAIITKSGRERAVEGYINVIKKENRTVGFVGTLRDITDKKRLAEQLLQVQKMEAVASLAGGMAHNFNNILVGIMGYAEYLLSKKDADDPDYKALSIIHEGTHRASELTRQLLSSARTGQFNPEKINLNDVVRKALPLIQGTFTKSIEIKTELAADLDPVEGDAGQLEQSLLNLCINARDAMPSGGLIAIETKNQRLDEAFVKDHIEAGEGDYIVVSVSDTGNGIPPSVRGRIFEPFFTTKEERGGTGMGLCSVYGIVKNHKGMITVASEVKKGSAFTLYFPSARKKGDGSLLSRGKKIKGESELILLIDDEPVVREMWGDFLNMLGYRVITARDGKEGVALVEQRRDEIDLVILDLIMPRLGGRETLVKIREIKPDIKVIITSGYTEYEKVKEMLGEKTVGFIPKPSRLEEISHKIREVLQEKGDD
jgi:two-component system cell cycle sensor histidine kinase/response regulator CckA